MRAALTITAAAFGAITIGLVIMIGMTQRTAPDPTVSQYVDTERGIVCYTYGSSGISCVRDE